MGALSGAGAGVGALSGAGARVGTLSRVGVGAGMGALSGAVGRGGGTLWGRGWGRGTLWGSGQGWGTLWSRGWGGGTLWGRGGGRGLKQGGHARALSLNFLSIQALYFYSSDVCGGLLWISETGECLCVCACPSTCAFHTSSNLCNTANGVPSTNQSDSPRDPRPDVDEQALSISHDGRDPSFWLCLHSTLLHPQQHLVSRMSVL